MYINKRTKKNVHFSLETEVTRTFSSQAVCLKLLQSFQYLREYTELLREEAFTLHNRMEKIKTSFS